MANKSLRECIYVWELPVRTTHWANVFAILMLAATGYYIGNPIIRGSVDLMSWMRAIHRIAAYAFIASLALRAYWSLAGNEFANWRVLFPYLTAEGLRGMRRTFLYYTFIRREPPREVGHNALAGVTYSLVVLVMFIEVLTGLALLSMIKGGLWSTAFGWVFLLLSPPITRLIHHMGMWLLLGFAVHHVYSAVLMDVEERNGLLASIFSGYKFKRI